MKGFRIGDFCHWPKEKGNAIPYKRKSRPAIIESNLMSSPLSNSVESWIEYYSEIYENAEVVHKSA